MADGRDDRYAMPAQRGRKLRNMGSNPTGTQKMSFTPEYSGEMDYAVGATPLNANVRRANPLDLDKPTQASRKLRGETGLISKEPLS